MNLHKKFCEFPPRLLIEIMFFNAESPVFLDAIHQMMDRLVQNLLIRFEHFIFYSYRVETFYHNLEKPNRNKPCVRLIKGKTKAALRRAFNRMQ